MDQNGDKSGYRPTTDKHLAPALRLYRSPTKKNHIHRINNKRHCYSHGHGGAQCRSPWAVTAGRAEFTDHEAHWKSDADYQKPIDQRKANRAKNAKTERLYDRGPHCRQCHLPNFFGVPIQCRISRSAKCVELSLTNAPDRSRIAAWCGHYAMG